MIERILVTCIHYPVASGRYIAAALDRLGYDVRTSGPSTGNEIWGGRVDNRHIWTPKDATAGWKPDLIINADSAYAPVTDQPVVLWGVDNHVRDYRLREWSAMYLAHSWGYRMDEENAHWLPCAYDPTVHFNTHQRRDIDVMCLGVMYPQRIEYGRAMMRGGIDGLYFVTGPIYEEYNNLYNRAKIAFVNSACGDLAQRFFENMAQGCCVLADKTVDAELLGFRAGVDYWTYESVPDAVEQAKFLLDSGLWRDVAICGERKVRSHTWDMRAAKLLKEIESQ